MNDHAKALAEALRYAKNHIEHMANFIAAKRAGYSFESLGEDMPGILEALAAYDTHLAEAATCENGDLRKLLDAADDALDKETYDQKRKDNFDAPDDAEYYVSVGTIRKINDVFQALDAALSTHQQQGADTPSDDVKAMVKSWPSLSRAPQPDTVTEG